MTVKITYTIVANANPNRPGFLPLISVNGKWVGSTYSNTSHTEENALAQAETLAEAEASKYIGDWNITIEVA